jgi:hypothetical protein
MSPGLRSPKLSKAIRHAIREAELAYEFCPGSYTASALNAVLAVEQVYLREPMSVRHTSTIDMPLPHDGAPSPHHRIT